MPQFWSHQLKQGIIIGGKRSGGSKCDLRKQWITFSIDLVSLEPLTPHLNFKVFAICHLKIATLPLWWTKRFALPSTSRNEWAEILLGKHVMLATPATQIYIYMFQDVGSWTCPRAGFDCSHFFRAACFTQSFARAVYMN